jgi:hypothetical protein
MQLKNIMADVDEPRATTRRIQSSGTRNFEIKKYHGRDGNGA